MLSTVVGSISVEILPYLDYSLLEIVGSMTFSIQMCFPLTLIPRSFTGLWYSVSFVSSSVTKFQVVLANLKG